MDTVGPRIFSLMVIRNPNLQKYFAHIHIFCQNYPQIFPFKVLSLEFRLQSYLQPESACGKNQEFLMYTQQKLLFFGPQNKDCHFSISDLEEIGRKSCESILVLYKSKEHTHMETLRKLGDYEAILQELVRNRTLIRNEAPEDDSEYEENKTEDSMIMRPVQFSEHNRAKSSVHHRANLNIGEESPSPSKGFSREGNNALKRSKRFTKRIGMKNYIILVDGSAQTIQSFKSEFIQVKDNFQCSKLFLPYFYTTLNSNSKTTTKVAQEVSQSTCAKSTFNIDPHLFSYPEKKVNLLKVIGTKPLKLPSQTQIRYCLYNNMEIRKTAVDTKEEETQTESIVKQPSVSPPKIRPNIELPLSQTHKINQFFPTRKHTFIFEMDNMMLTRSNFPNHKRNETNLRKSINPIKICLLYTSPSPRDLSTSRMPSSA
eukprot:TRINITY_DN36972_c0_g1_i1.p1 TRINITY_DN36972_c0_g1~~TRINITY_DN36972_c0_g1_i1.p1  ORF type:complete len:428 (-),score=37.56 TRINITY_DN36972_c0_g1_i1:128-1411(-)